MENRKTLTLIALALSCVRLLAIIISALGMLLLGNDLVTKVSNVLYQTGTIIHIAIILFIAYALSLIKESIWRSMAFVFFAFMSTVFLMLGLLKLTDTKIISSIAALNLFVITFFVVQLYLISNNFFKGAFKIYGVVMVLMVIVNAAIPFVAYKLALPQSTLRYTAFLYLLPAAVELYIVFLFNRYFNSPTLHQHNDFTNDL